MFVSATMRVSFFIALLSILLWDFIATVNGQGGSVVRRIILSPDAAPPAPYFSQGVQIDQILYISGQLGLNQSDQMADGFEAQARQALDNIGHILRAAGSDFDHVVKTTVLLGDIENFALFNEIYAPYFPNKPPVRMAYQVAAIPRNGLVEVEAIAAVGEIIESDEK